MGYSNHFKIRAEGTISKQVKVSENSDFSTEDLSANFCPKTGAPLKLATIQIDPMPDVMKDLLAFSEDAKFLLNSDGSTRETGSGYDLAKDIQKVSKSFPNLTLILTCVWDSGLLDEGDVGTDFYFFRNGVKKEAEVQVVWKNPFTQEIFQ